jgi:hypothetical protein
MEEFTPTVAARRRGFSWAANWAKFWPDSLSLILCFMNLSNLSEKILKFEGGRESSDLR